MSSAKVSSREISITLSYSKRLTIGFDPIHFVKYWYLSWVDLPYTKYFCVMNSASLNNRFIPKDRLISFDLMLLINCSSPSRHLSSSEIGPCVKRCFKSETGYSSS